MCRVFIDNVPTDVESREQADRFVKAHRGGLWAMAQTLLQGKPIPKVRIEYIDGCQYGCQLCDCCKEVEND